MQLGPGDELSIIIYFPKLHIILVFSMGNYNIQYLHMRQNVEIQCYQLISMPEKTGNTKMTI